MPTRGRGTVRVDPDQTLRELEVPVLLDMLHFGLAHADFVVRSMEDLQKLTRDRGGFSEAGKRAFLVAVFREEMHAYENLGAVVHALRRFASGKDKSALRGILTYAPGEAIISDLLTGNVVTEIEANAIGGVSDADLEGAGFRRGKQYLFSGLVTGAREFGVIQGSSKQPRCRAYNKIKHGCVFMLNPRRISKAMPAGVPAAIFGNPDETQVPHAPFVIFGLFPRVEHHVESLKHIHFAAFTARLLIAMYLWSQRRVEVSTDAPTFAAMLPIDVREVLAEIDLKGFGPARP